MKKNKLCAMMRCLKVICLILAYICLGFNALAQKKTQEPQADEYFDLIGVRDEDDNLCFKSGSNEIGFLRTPSDYEGYNDRKYYIFTNKRWIRLSDADSDGNSNIETIIPFDSLVINDHYKEGGKRSIKINAERPRGYIKTKEGELKLKDGKSGREILFHVVVVEDWAWNEVELRIKKYLHKNPIIISFADDEKVITCDSIFISGDSISLEVERKRRGIIKSLTFEKRPLIGEYELLRDKTSREKDDIVTTKSTLKIDKEILPPVKDTTDIDIRIAFEYIKDGQLQMEEKIVKIKVAPQEDTVRSLAWGTVWWIVGVVLVVLGLIVYFFRKRSKSAEANEVNEAKETKDTLLPEDIVETTPKLEEDPTMNVFEQISNEEAAKVLLKYLEGVYGIGKQRSNVDDLRAATNKSWVRQFCNEWNKKDWRLPKINTSQYNEPFLFNHIQKGYIGEGAKKILDEFRDGKCKEEKDYVKVLEAYKKTLLTEGENKGYSQKFNEIPTSKETMVDSDIRGGDGRIRILERKIEELQEQLSKERENSCIEQKKNAEAIAVREAKEKELSEELKRVLLVLKEQHFVVDEKEAPQSAFEAVKFIALAVNGGVKDYEKQAEIDRLNRFLESEKERQEEEKKQAENKFREREDELHKKNQENIRIINENHQKEVEQLKCNYQIKVDDLSKDHVLEVTNKENKIQQLNAEIDHQKKKMEELGKEVHSDCAYYIETLVAQMGGLQKLIDSLYKSTCDVSGGNSQYSNVIKKIKENYEKFCEQVNQSNTSERWCDNAVTLLQVRKELQGYIAAGLRSTGWVNIVNYLNLYAGATIELNDSFNANGLYTNVLSQLYGDTQKLIGMFGVKVVVPYLLVEKFDDQYFEFENADQWIQKFSTDLRPKDYESKIFDMSCIGYQIEDDKYNKPKVFYY